MKKVITLFVLLMAIPMLIFAGEYGSMYITNNSTDQGDLGDADTWYQVTGFSEMITSGDWAFSANELTGDEDCAGKYLLRFSLSFRATEALWDIAVDVDGTKYGIIERRISSSSDIGNVSACCLVDVGNSQSTALYVKADADPTSFIPIHSQIVMVEMCQATTPYYGEMGISSNSSTQNLSTTWSTIENYDISHANLAGWTFSNNILTDETGTSGDYLVILSVSFSGATAADYEFGISKGDADPYGNGGTDTEIVFKRTIGSGKVNDLGNGGACGIINISSSDNIRVKAKTAGSYGVTVAESNLTFIKLDATNTTPYASMVVNSNTNDLTLNQGVWTQEPDFGDGTRDATYWQFSEANDNLTPINLSAGYYLLNFFLSVSVETGANAEFDAYCAIFDNGSQIYDATVVRQLQKKTGDNRDIGAASGTAIITVDNPNVALDLRLYQNNLSSVATDVKYASIDLFRIATINGGTLPVELSAFTAQYINNVPMLYWTTQSETDNMGWFIYRNDENNFSSSEVISGMIEGHGTTTQHQNYVYEDSIENPEVGDTYYYWLESIDYSGTIHHYDRVVLINIPEVDDSNNSIEIPSKYDLIAGPNPFDTDLTIRYMLPKTDMVRIEIYNLYGQLVAEFNEGLRIADKKYSIDWNGRDLYGQNIASGVLLIKLITSEGSETTKVILLR